MKLNEETKRIDDLLRNINKLIIKYTKDQLGDYGLTLSRFHALWMICKQQPINMSKLHEKMYVANSTLTVFVNRLVDDNFVKRYRDQDDRRVVLLEVTPEGEECLEHILKLRQTFLQEGLEELGHQEQEQLIELLNPVLDKIEDKIERE